MATTSSAVDAVVDAIGFGAGLFVAVALLPQIYRAHQRKSAKDLSFFWQVAVAIGVAMQLVYLEHYKMWAVFIPILAELVFILYLTGLKVYFDFFGHRVEEAPNSPVFLNTDAAGVEDHDASEMNGEEQNGRLEDPRARD